jgi:hypothetical protein
VRICHSQGQKNTRTVLSWPKSGQSNFSANQAHGECAGNRQKAWMMGTPTDIKLSVRSRCVVVTQRSVEETTQASNFNAKRRYGSRRLVRFTRLTQCFKPSPPGLLPTKNTNIKKRPSRGGPGFQSESRRVRGESTT